MESASKGTQPLVQGPMDVAKDFKAALLGTGHDKASLAQRALQEADMEAHNITDSQFFSKIIELDIIRKNKKLEPSVQRAKDRAHKSLMVAVPKLASKLVGLIKQVQEDAYRATIRAETIRCKGEEQRKLRLQLIRHVNGPKTQIQDHPHTLRIDSIEVDKGKQYYNYTYKHSFKVWGARETLEDPLTLFTIRTMSLTEQDKHELQLNPSTIPSPRFRFEHTFRLPQGYTVMRAQLLPSDKILLVVADRLGNLSVYLESLTIHSCFANIPPLRQGPS